MLNSTTNSILPELRRYGIELKVGKIPHCVLWSFPGAISQIITNLVFNSINHAFTGIEDKQIALHSETDPQSGALSLIYRDNGNGIPEKDQQSVFEPYFTTRREAGGSGLGLSIVKALATNKLKGDLTFKSAPKRGVEFAFTLPLDIRPKSP
ncbi:MAG: ATP-binding protein [Gammaproteobacteria bacterium]|nr:ATP-binding protein [Gammaproteobacteria bacterium]